MNTKTLIAALVSAPCLAGLGIRGDTIELRVADGIELRKELTVEMTFTLEDASMEADGEDMSEGIPGDLEFAADGEISVTDRYVAVRAGKPVELIRRFESISGRWSAEGGGQSESGDVPDIGDLEGHSVRFAWSDEEEAYDVAFEGEAGDSALLEGLDPDLDFRVLLPERAVAEGDRWEVSGPKLGPIFFAGAISSTPDAGGDDETARILIETLEPQLQRLGEDVKVICTYTGSREVGGARVGAIKLALEGDGSLDCADALARVIETSVPSELEVDLDVERAQVKFEFGGAGELLWHLAEGRLHSFELDPELDLELDFAISADVEGESHSVSASLQLRGKGAWRAAVAD
jgi:hypothetical protein